MAQERRSARPKLAPKGAPIANDFEYIARSLPYRIMVIGQIRRHEVY